MSREAAVRAAYQILPAADVRARIAAALLAVPNERFSKLGDVSLQPHQVLGMGRLLDLIAQHQGALLADEVGLGKTYTALGVASRFKRAEVVAPAALRAMWHEASSRAQVPVGFISSESLSRHAQEESAADLVVIDEAHWFRNASTKRYRNLARRYRRAAVLLLSATPLHNRPADLQSLFALFLGRRAGRLTPCDIGTLTVRRSRTDTLVEQPPFVMPSKWRRVRCNARLLTVLGELEAPIPTRDGDVAATLLRLTLLQRLTSSHAALRATLKRLLSRALALLDAANAGRYPTASELRAWMLIDDSIQLAFPELVVEASDRGQAIPRDAIERHVASVRAAMRLLDAEPNEDEVRAGFLIRLLRRYPDARIVAFSQYAATVTSLGRLLRRHAGVALLSAKGGRIASGRISRAEVLQQFDASCAGRKLSNATCIRLLLTTDLLSEGVNLHNANVVVHLDVPWTAARLEQRVGRLSRLGSPHRRVFVYGFAPPSAVERMQRKVARLRVKWHASRQHVGASELLEHDAILASRRYSDGSHARDAHALQRLLIDWLGTSHTLAALPLLTPAVAHVNSAQARSLTLALLRSPSGPALLAIDGSKASNHPRDVLHVAQRLSDGADAAPQRDKIENILQCVRRYIARRRGDEAARGHSTGAATAALQSRIAAAISLLPRNERLHALRLSNKLREAIASARSAGDQMLLSERAAALLELNDTVAMPWIATAQRELTACCFKRDRPASAQSDRWTLDAILIGT